MTIIADSGSTKTTWMEVETGKTVLTEGLNPHFSSEEQFMAACVAVRQNFQLSAFNCQLFFYGAGCGLPAQREKVASWLAKAFGTSDVHVETDMLAACRATAGGQPGLVGILGTGSNACYYDGQRITHQAFSTGYILGDHGSANHIGRLILHNYLCDTMPPPLDERFKAFCPMTKQELMDAVYHQPNANRFLASLAPFVVQNSRFGYCYAMIANSLDQWYHYQLMNICNKTNCRELSVVGGFAATIKTPLHHMAEDNDLVIRKIMADPIEGLRRYHRKK